MHYAEQYNDLPVSGTSVGLAIDLIWSKFCKSGDNPKERNTILHMTTIQANKTCIQIHYIVNQAQHSTTKS